MTHGVNVHIVDTISTRENLESKVANLRCIDCTSASRSAVYDPLCGLLDILFDCPEYVVISHLAMDVNDSMISIRQLSRFIF